MVQESCLPIEMHVVPVIAVPDIWVIAKRRSPTNKQAT